MKLNIVFALVVISTIFIPSAFADSISIEIDNIDYDVDYVGNNVVLKSAIADLNFISLIFETEVSGSDGDVSITFQRDFFDAKFGTEIDDEFFILSDGDEIEFEETKTDESRTLSFSLSVGTEEVEIIGTILANNSFLLEQEVEADAKAQAEADAKAQAEADAKAQAEADTKAQADAKAQAEADAKVTAEEQKLEKLMNACGDGTIFENGECVLSPMEKNANNVNPGPLIYSVVIGLMIGIVITLILWGIGKKSHKVLSDDDS